MKNSFKKIINNLSQPKKTLKETIKTSAQIATLCAGIMSTTGCDNSNTNNRNRKPLKEDMTIVMSHEIIKTRVEKIFHNADSPFTIYSLPYDEKQRSICHVGRFRYNNTIQEITAKHCFNMDFPARKFDILIGENISYPNHEEHKPPRTKKLRSGYIEWKILEVSPLSHKQLDWSEISIEGCLTHKNPRNDVCYKITGEALYNEENEIFTIMISDKIYRDIITSNNDHSRLGLYGISGAPVLDREGRIMGIVIQSTDMNKWLTYQGITFHALVINPLRTRDGNIKGLELPGVNYSSNIEETMKETYENIGKNHERENIYRTLPADKFFSPQELSFISIMYGLRVEEVSILKNDLENILVKGLDNITHEEKVGTLSLLHIRKNALTKNQLEGIKNLYGIIVEEYYTHEWSSVHIIGKDSISGEQREGKISLEILEKLK